MRMSRKIRKKIAQSGHGECAICGNKELLVLHHIQGRKIIDWNKPWNEAWICSNCHFGIHSKHPNRIIVEGWQYSTDGRILSWHYANEKNN